MNQETFYTSAVPVEPGPPEKNTKPLTSRLRKSKNFHKMDRELENYIDSNKLIKTGPKSLLRKLLLLRGNEDSNEVKTTVSGLSKLLDVDKKTIRDWLKQLQDKQFIFSQGEVWDPHCNFPKKKFVFAHTFPDFDPAAVFIQKGAKAKYKQRMAKKAGSAAAVKGKICKPKTPTNTCPVSPSLLDCSTHCVRGTRSNKRGEDTKVSSPPAPALLLTSVASPDFRSAKPARRSNKFKEHGQDKTPMTVLDCSSELRSLLTTILTQAKNKGRIQWLSHFIDKCTRENGSIQTWEDIHELADDLCYVIPEQFSPKRGKTLASMFQFLREYISNFTGHSYYRSREYQPQYRSYEWDQHHDAFLKRYPSCLPHPVTGRETGVNR